MGDTWIVVAGGPPAWDACGSRALRMAESFWSLGYKVLYLESGGTHEPFEQVTGEVDQHGHDVVAHLEHRGLFFMRASQFLGLPVVRPELIRRRNCARTSKRATRFLASSGASKVIVCHYCWHLQGLFHEARKTVSHVYECTADHRNAPGVVGRPGARRHLARVEDRLLARSDLVVFSSPELARLRGPQGRTAVLPLAVDSAHFSGQQDAKDPHERLNITSADPDHPRIGFVGELASRTDARLLRGAATQAPAWHWVLAGPHRGIRPHGPPNLHWLGPVRYDEVPAWLRNWNVGIMPLSPASDYSRLTSPANLLEYLAAGLPVASTDVPAARALAEQLPELVFLAHEPSPTGLIEAVKNALAVPPARREAGRTFAEQHSWPDRAKCLLSALAEQRNHAALAPAV